MKKILLPVLFLLSANFAFGQSSYIPMLAESNQWNILHIDDSFGPGHTEKTWTTFIYSIKDTLINDKKYSRFFSSGNTGFLLREDTIERKVYIVEKYDGVFNEVLLYDFGMSIGDTMSFYYDESIIFTLRLDSIKNIQFENGINTREYFLGVKIIGFGEDYNWTLTWIEGMGGTSNFYYPQCIGVTGCETYNKFLCFNREGELSYRNPDYDSCFSEYLKVDDLNMDKIVLKPNPVFSKLEIETDFDYLKSKIYDTNGKLMITSTDNIISVDNLHPGLYFVKILDKKGDNMVRKFIKN